MKKRFIIAFMMFGFIGAASAAIGKAAIPNGTEPDKNEVSATDTSASRATPMSVKDVETLNDKLSTYSGKRVKVSGEVKDKLDGQSFVLESGGIFNDEIVVVGSKDKSGIRNLKEDQDVTVTGVLHTIPIVEVRRELSWDLDPQIETELDDVKAFLVIDQVAVNK